jgi:aryl-alcohol dehydrogenase-like predicted oxidoreductase
MSTPAASPREIVGKALAGGRRDHVVLATKVHGTMGDDPIVRLKGMPDCPIAAKQLHQRNGLHASGWVPPGEDRGPVHGGV